MTYKPNIRQLVFVLPQYCSKAEIIFTKSRENIAHSIMKVNPNSEPRYHISTEKLEKGIWIAQLLWSVGQSHYCAEKLIEIA